MASNIGYFCTNWPFNTVQWIKCPVKTAPGPIFFPRSRPLEPAGPTQRVGGQPRQVSICILTPPKSHQADTGFLLSFKFAQLLIMPAGVLAFGSWRLGRRGFHDAWPPLAGKMHFIWPYLGNLTNDYKGMFEQIWRPLPNLHLQDDHLSGAHHRAILTALLAQGQHTLALRFVFDCHAL